MDDDESMDLLHRYRAGDEDAARALFDRYVYRLIALARTRLSSRLARRIDPEDVVQSVYRSFFRSAAEGNFELIRSGDLWRLLVAMTLNKIRMQARRHTANIRDMLSEESMAANALGLVFAPEQISKEPRPEEVVALTELLEALMSPMTPQARKILEMRLQNFKIEEIAAEIECSERTVRRQLDRVKQKLHEDFDRNR